MPRIAAAASALPPYRVPQEEVRQAIASLFTGRVPGLERLLRVFDNARIEQRQFVQPLAWYSQPRTRSERNRVYLDTGLDLLAEAAERCLQQAGCARDEVDHVIAVSSSGHATPSLDALLINRLGLRPGTTRLPIWGMGCAGGAGGLARAFDYGRAHPRARILLAALETCSLTFLEKDLSKKNLVATALFSDGAAAVLVVGSEVAADGPRIIATNSHLFPQTERIMGWDFEDEGMWLVLSARLPTLVRESLPALVDGFLASRGLGRKDIVHHLAHPGGARVLDGYRTALGLENGELALAEAVLADHGNVSSVSVLLVLERWLARRASHLPGWGLLTAFGPGFCAEQVLLEA